MRTLKLHFPDDALPTLDTFLKQTKEARVFRRAQAVRAVVKGQRLQTVSDTLHFTYCAAHMGPSLCPPWAPEPCGSSPLRSTTESDGYPGAPPRSPRRPKPAPARRKPFPMELSGTRDRPRPPDRGPAQP